MWRWMRSCSGWRVVRLTSFSVEGVPRPQGSKRAVGGGRFIEASKYLPEWRKSVVGAAREAHEGEPIQGAVTVTAEFVFPRPKALKPHSATALSCKKAPLYRPKKTAENAV